MSFKMSFSGTKTSKQACSIQFLQVQGSSDQCVQSTGYKT